MASETYLYTRSHQLPLVGSSRMPLNHFTTHDLIYRIARSAMPRSRNQRCVKRNPCSSDIVGSYPRTFRAQVISAHLLFTLSQTLRDWYSNGLFTSQTLCTFSASSLIAICCPEPTLNTPPTASSFPIAKSNAATVSLTNVKSLVSSPVPVIVRTLLVKVR